MGPCATRYSQHRLANVRNIYWGSVGRSPQVSQSNAMILQNNRISRELSYGGFIDELLAARGAGSPVKFIVSVMPEADGRWSDGRRVCGAGGRG
jgi:hypothetical protein